MPYGITQYYLPPGRGDIPAFTPSRLRLVLDLATEMTAYWPIEQKRPKQVFQRFCRALLEECSFQLETLAADCDAWQSACEIGKNWQPPIKLWSTDMPESILPLSVPASRPRSPTCDKIWYIHDVKQCSPSMSTTVLCY